TFSTDEGQANYKPTVSKETQPKTVVRLFGIKSPYKENCPIAVEAIGRRLVEHCLPFFLDARCPAVPIRAGETNIDLNSYFQEMFKGRASEHNFKVNDESFRLRGFRVYTPQDTQHRLVYAAKSRGVLQERLENCLPNLKRQLRDEKGAFAYLGFVEGSYLDQHVNGERTDFSFP